MDFRKLHTQTAPLIIGNIWDIPLNVLCMPKLPSFERLQQIGVKRISMGDFLFEKMYQFLKTCSSQILEEQSATKVFE